MKKLLALVLLASMVVPATAEHLSGGKRSCVPAYIRNDMSPEMPSLILAVPVTLLTLFGATMTAGTQLQGKGHMASLVCSNAAILKSAAGAREGRGRN